MGTLKARWLMVLRFYLITASGSPDLVHKLQSHSYVLRSVSLCKQRFSLASIYTYRANFAIFVVFQNYCALSSTVNVFQWNVFLLSAKMCT